MKKIIVLLLALTLSCQTLPTSTPAPKSTPMIPTVVPTPTLITIVIDPMEACGLYPKEGWHADLDNKRRVTIDEKISIKLEFDGYMLSAFVGAQLPQIFTPTPGIWRLPVQVRLYDADRIVTDTVTVPVIVGICDGKMYKYSPPLPEVPMPDHSS